MGLAIWNVVAKNIDTSLGQFPGPAQAWEQTFTLIDEHSAQREKAAAFYERQEVRNAKRVAQDPTYVPKIRDFTGAPTFFDQIWTSLYTVMVGFFIASIVAVPVGILCGLSKSASSAMNPLIQIFKPVSPLAWLPLVTMVVSAVNVSEVLRLKPLSHVQKIVLPASIPMIFTGLRLSLGIGWMVLIAAEMLAQNPGLGKFVWDEFQNGSSESLARIMVAVLTIGAIGFVLDRIMLMFQRMVSWDKNSVLR